MYKHIHSQFTPFVFVSHYFPFYSIINAMLSHPHHCAWSMKVIGGHVGAVFSYMYIMRSRSICCVLISYSEFSNRYEFVMVYVDWRIRSMYSVNVFFLYPNWKKNSGINTIIHDQAHPYEWHKENKIRLLLNWLIFIPLNHDLKSHTPSNYHGRKHCFFFVCHAMTCNILTIWFALLRPTEMGFHVIYSLICSKLHK